MDLTIRYDELRGISSPIISGLAHLITHLGGKEMSNHEIDGFVQQAKVDALGLHAAAMPLTALPAQDAMLPPDKPKSSLKAGKFFPARSSTPPPPARTN
jgi:hypothetical protein